MICKRPEPPAESRCRFRSKSSASRNNTLPLPPSPPLPLLLMLLLSAPCRSSSPGGDRDDAVAASLLASRLLLPQASTMGRGISRSLWVAVSLLLRFDKFQLLRTEYRTCVIRQIAPQRNWHALSWNNNSSSYCTGGIPPASMYRSLGLSVGEEGWDTRNQPDRRSVSWLLAV